MDDEDQTIEASSLASGSDVKGDVDAFILAPGEDTVTSGPLDVPNRRRRHVALTAAAVAVVLVISLIVIGVSGPGSKDAAAEVILGARTTLAKNSVDLTLSGSMSADGQTIPLGGSGFADSSKDLESVTLTFSDENIPIQETILSDAGNAYMQITENNQNQITRAIPGKQWVQVPLGASQSTGLSATTPNILNQLQVLTQQGNTVVPLGTSTINGESVTGYQVTITKAAMAAEFKRVEARGGAEAKALEQGLKVISLNPPVIKLWLNADNLLAREEVLISETTSGVTASGDLFINFSNYGSASTITTPAAGSVASFQAFIAAADAPGLH
jgi:hypothetical protein